MFDQANGHWQTGALEPPYGRGVNFEMTGSTLDALYQRVLAAQLPLFRPLSESRYQAGAESLVQREFLFQDPDGYLFRFTD